MIQGLEIKEKERKAKERINQGLSLEMAGRKKGVSNDAELK